MIRRVAATAVASMCVVAAAGAPCPAFAYGSSYGISSFTAGSSGSIGFTVESITNPALAGSQTYTYTLIATSSTNGGTVTVTAPTIMGTNGDSIPAADFTATCTETYDRYGSFTSSGTVMLRSTAVTCARISTNSSVDATFTVTLTLNCGTAAGVAFPADTYFQYQPLSVTANVS